MHRFAATAADNQVHLRLMETTDLHVAIFPYDYYADAPDDTVGLGRTAALIARARAEAANSVLIDNGDLIQGNPLGDYAAYERGSGPGTIHPVFTAMNTLGYEVSTLGNHEFNYGLDFLDRALAGAGFPFVCANLVRAAAITGDDPLRDRTYMPPFRIVEKKVVDGAGNSRRLRLGFIGFLPPQIMLWDSANLDGKVVVRDIVSTAHAYVPVMKEQGADVIVALSHSGIDGRQTDMMENAALFLAAVPGIDVILAGHQHLVFPNGRDFAGIPGVDPHNGTLMGKPAVMAGFWGSHLGLIDLLIEPVGDSWRIVDHTSEARPIWERRNNRIVPTVDDVPAVEAPVQADHDATLAYVRRPVGRTSVPLFSYFALVADDPSVQIVADAQLWYLRRMLKGTEWESLPLLSASAPFKAGGRAGPGYYTDVPAGPLAIRNIADLYLYPNAVRAVLVTGAQVKEWLERSAGLYNRIEPGAQDTPLIDPAFPSFDFDIMKGVSYKIDVSQPSRYDAHGVLIAPEAHRILDLAYEGRPIDPAGKFVIATNNYRAGGGGNFPGADGSTIIFQAPDTIRDVIVRYVHECGTVNPRANGNWSLAPLPGTTVLFQSSPRAGNHLDAVKGLSIAYAGEGENGFGNYRIAL